LPTLEETLDLCKMIESCGVKAIAVHGKPEFETCLIEELKLTTVYFDFSRAFSARTIKTTLSRRLHKRDSQDPENSRNSQVRRLDY